MKKPTSTFICLLSFLLASLSGLSAVSAQPEAPASVTDSIPPPFSGLRARSFIFPATLMAYGCLKPVIPGIQKLDERIFGSIAANRPGFGTNADAVLQWVPGGSVYLLDAFRVRTAHTFRQHLAVDLGSMLVAGGAGFIMRRISRGIPAFNTRPGTQFPSGHTTNAFRGAEILHQELKARHPVWSYSGYLLATAVGLMRMYNREHFLSEVVAGAGLGILSTRLTYWGLGKFEKRKRKGRGR